MIFSRRCHKELGTVPQGELTLEFTVHTLTASEDSLTALRAAGFSVPRRPRCSQLLTLRSRRRPCSA